MKNYIQEGRQIDLTASGAVTSGDLVVVGELVGVATTDAVASEVYAVSTTGVFDLAKGAGALTVGTKVYAAAGVGNNVTTTDTDVEVGVVVADAASDDTVVRVRLTL